MSKHLRKDDAILYYILQLTYRVSRVNPTSSHTDGGPIVAESACRREEPIWCSSARLPYRHVHVKSEVTRSSKLVITPKLSGATKKQWSTNHGQHIPRLQVLLLTESLSQQGRSLPFEPFLSIHQTRKVGDGGCARRPSDRTALALHKGLVPQGVRTDAAGDWGTAAGGWSEYD